MIGDTITAKGNQVSFHGIERENEPAQGSASATFGQTQKSTEEQLANSQGVVLPEFPSRELEAIRCVQQEHSILAEEAIDLLRKDQCLA